MIKIDDTLYRVMVTTFYALLFCLVFYQIVIDIGFERGVKYSVGEFVWKSDILCREMMDDSYAEADIEEYDTGFSTILIIECISEEKNTSQQIMSLRLDYE